MKAYIMDYCLMRYFDLVEKDCEILQWPFCKVNVMCDDLIFYALDFSFLLPCSIRKWKYGDGEKIVFEIRAGSDSTTLKELRKVTF